MNSALFTRHIANSLWRRVAIPILLATCYLLFAASVHAQTSSSVNQPVQPPPQANPYTILNTNPDVPKNLHTGVQGTMIEVMAAMICQLAGIDPINPNQKCLGVDQATGAIGFVESGGGALGVANHMIAVTFTPPIRTSTYINYISENFGLAKPAYAQGVGFDGLKPLINLWGAFRNIAYLGFILVFVLIGLAIMLRVKIDPRTVMTVQNQIPRIIIALLLVTFSFAIAGLLIDLMYVSMYTMYSIIASSGAINPANLAGLNPVRLQGATPFWLADALAENTAWLGTIGFVAHITSTVTPFVQSILGLGGFFGGIGNFNTPVSILIHAISLGAGAFIGLNFAQVVAPIISALPFGIGTVIGIPISIAATIIAGGIALVATEALLRYLVPFLIVYLIILIAILWAMFRLWFTLIKSYIFFLLDVVLAPIWITFGLLPGNESVNFGSWLRDMIANISAFPVTLTMFLLGKVFIDAFVSNSDQLFVPPLIGNPNGGSASPIGAIIGLGIILMTPQVVAIIKDLIKSPQFKYASAIGQAIGAGGGVMSGATKTSIGGIFAAKRGAYPQPGETGLPAVSRFLVGKI